MSRPGSTARSADPGARTAEGAPRISLALAIHNHQPVGNFGWVIEDVFEHAYRPMVEALDRHPRVRLALHYTGPLLDWLRRERPAFLEAVRVLVERGQVEVLGGGYYEPVLASLPEPDRVGQLVRMADEIESTFGTRPAGAWLAERVWEPDLPTSLAEARYRWTILDDAHFRAAAIADDELWWPYTTDDQGRPIVVFGTEKGLRYRIPFQEVDDVIDHLRRNASSSGDRLGTMGDDGEKFGAWPTTWEHCWGRGRWVERFFEALEANADWLTTVTPSAWLGAHPPIGRVYIPTGSYEEMGEWALPPRDAVAFGEVMRRDEAAGRAEARWLRGGFWRNFQIRYREINDLHKQMLRTSSKVAAMPPGPARDRAEDHLYQGQSNDCYWHGLFGGIYISHMRLATHEHLIAAEDLADAALGAWSGSAVADLDLDGRDEVRLAGPGQVVAIDLDEGAGIAAWDLRAVRHALTAVLRRRPEAYHERLRAYDRGAAVERSGGGEDTTSIHEIVTAKEPHLSGHLFYDWHERRSGLVRFLPLDTTPAEFAEARERELSDVVDRAWELVTLDDDRLVVARDGSVAAGEPDGPRAVHVVKSFRLGGDRLGPTLDLDLVVENRSDRPIDARLGVEWATTMLGGGGNPDAWWAVGDARHRHDSAGSATDVARLAQGNDYVGVAVTSAIAPPADAWWSPIETVSNSESGFERVYQGSQLLLSWPVRLEPGARASFSVGNAVLAARDRAAEEAAAPSTGGPR